MASGGSKDGRSTKRQKTIHAPEDDEVDYVVIDSLKVPTSKPRATRKNATTTDAKSGRSEPDGVLKDSKGRQHARPCDKDPGKQTSLSQSNDGPSTLEIQPFDNAPPQPMSCNACTRLARVCDYYHPVCGPCAEATRSDCTWDQVNVGRESRSPHHGAHMDSQPVHQPFASFDDADFGGNFNLDFSTLDNAEVLENFDFDAFLNNSNDAAFSFASGIGDEETDYWRNTVGVAEPRSDVERPRPRPR